MVHTIRKNVAKHFKIDFETINTFDIDLFDFEGVYKLNYRKYTIKRIFRLNINDCLSYCLLPPVYAKD